MQDFQFDARAVVFDLDGVLVDTMPAIRATWTQWAVERNLAPADVLASIHMTGVELVRQFAPELEDPLAEVHRISARQRTAETALPRFDGSLEMLEQLPLEGWGIVTSARREPALRHLAMAGLPVPHVLVTAELTPRGKPDPSGFRLAAERLQVRPAECVAIEDSPAGIRAAVAAGMHALGVTNTHPARELRDADAVISSLTEVELVADRGRMMTVRRRANR
jgi:mannitol-1-/sugar-/sorbitol-6-phosphatase